MPSPALFRSIKLRALGPRERVCGFIIDCRIRFHLDDNSGAFAPNQFRADEFARTREQIALEETRREQSLMIIPTHSLFHLITYVTKTESVSVAIRSAAPLVFVAVKPTACSRPEFYVAFNRLAVTERRDEFRAVEIG